MHGTFRTLAFRSIESTREALLVSVKIEALKLCYQIYNWNVFPETGKILGIGK